jgi:hypothetical protein
MPQLELRHHVKLHPQSDIHCDDDNSVHDLQHRPQYGPLHNVQNDRVCTGLGSGMSECLTKYTGIMIDVME